MSENAVLGIILVGTLAGIALLATKGSHGIPTCPQTCVPKCATGYCFYQLDQNLTSSTNQPVLVLQSVTPMPIG